MKRQGGWVSDFVHYYLLPSPEQSLYQLSEVVNASPRSQIFAYLVGWSRQIKCRGSCKEGSEGIGEEDEQYDSVVGRGLC